MRLCNIAAVLKEFVDGNGLGGAMEEGEAGKRIAFVVRV